MTKKIDKKASKMHNKDVIFFIKQKCGKAYKKAFSLLELSVVLAVLGATAAVSIPAVSYLMKSNSAKQDTIKALNIQNALKDYFFVHQRLPRPASITITRENANYGKEKTAKDENDISFDSDFHTATRSGATTTQTKINVQYVIFRGIIPFKDLGLTEEDVVDNSGNFFEYYVPEIMSLPVGSSPLSYNTSKVLYKTGYGLRNTDNGTYYEYPCVSQKNSNPSVLCDKDGYNKYGVSFVGNSIYQIDSNHNGYVALDYIRADGSQTINLNYRPTTSTKIRFKYVYEKWNGSTFIGYTAGDDAKDYRFFVATDGNTYFDAGDNSKRLSVKYITSNTSIYETEISNYAIKNLQNNSTLASSSSSVRAPDASISLFSSSDYGKIYYIQIYEGSTLKRNYIPCYRTSDGVIGMYETIEKKFYTSSGGNAFEKGGKNPVDELYIQPPYGLRVRDMDREIAEIKYDSDNEVYISNPLASYFDKNGEVAYVIVSHGANGDATCAIKSPKNKTTKPNVISILTNCAKTEQDTDNKNIMLSLLDVCTGTKTSKYEAQNCFNVVENNSLSLIGRAKFLNGKNHELTFYQGGKNEFFDDIVVYGTIGDLARN